MIATCGAFITPRYSREKCIACEGSGNVPAVMDDLDSLAICSCCEGSGVHRMAGERREVHGAQRVSNDDLFGTRARA